MTGAVSVRAMTAAEFGEWRAVEIEAYAAEIADASGLPLEQARARSVRQTSELLPDGPATARMHLLRVLDAAGAAVGVLWVGPHPQREDAGWVYDVAIDETRRGEGLGRAAMLAAEEVCREQGWSVLGLNVFGPNSRARALYDSLGYTVVNTSMLKPVAPGPLRG